MMMRQADDGEGRRRARLPAAERRETILRGAAAVFAESGYRAAKVSDVAARVGVTEPVIFQNFGSKAALFAAVVGRAAADARDALDELAAGPWSGAGLLAHVLTGPAAGDPGHAAPPEDPGLQNTGPQNTGPQNTGPQNTGPQHKGPGGGHAGTAYGVLFADAAALAAEPELSGPVRDAVRGVAAHLTDLVRHAQARGGARPDADPEAVAWLLLSVLAARRLRAATMPDGLEPVVTALALQALEPAAAGPDGESRR